MVEDGIVNRRKLDAVSLVASAGRRSHAQKADHDVMNVGLSRHLFVPVLQITTEHSFDGNARTGRRLAGDGDVGLRYDNVAPNDSGHLEDDNARSPSLAGRIQASRARRVQVRHLDHSATAAAGRVRAKTLCAWERWQRIARD